jgi:hypothetical protein
VSSQWQQGRHAARPRGCCMRRRRTMSLRAFGSRIVSIVYQSQVHNPTKKGFGRYLVCLPTLACRRAPTYATQAKGEEMDLAHVLAANWSSATWQHFPCCINSKKCGLTSLFFATTRQISLKFYNLLC